MLNISWWWYHEIGFSHFSHILYINLGARLFYDERYGVRVQSTYVWQSLASNSLRSTFFIHRNIYCRQNFVWWYNIRLSGVLVERVALDCLPIYGTTDTYKTTAVTTGNSIFSVFLCFFFFLSSSFYLFLFPSFFERLLLELRFFMSRGKE